MRNVAADVGVPPRMRPAVDAYLALGAVGLLATVIHVVGQLVAETLSPGAAVGAYYGLEGLAAWVGLQLATYGLVGIGGTALYARVADVDAGARLPTRGDARPIAALGGVVAGATVLAVATNATLGVPLSWFGDRFGRTVAVFGPTNPAPDVVVGGVVLATRTLVVAPAVGVVAHGVLGATLSETASPVAGVAGGAVVLVAMTTPVTALASPSVAAATAVLLAVGAAAGVAHERTGSLLAPAAAYGLLVLATSAARLATPL